MNSLDLLKNIKPVEIGILVIFVLYLIIPSETPSFVGSFMNSPLGFIFLFIVTISFFVYTNPILGVLFILVAYELLRRSSVQPVFSNILQTAPSQAQKDQELRAMNPPVHTTLEEEVVQVMAPIGRSSEMEIVNSSFKPVSDKIISGTSMY